MAVTLFSWGYWGWGNATDRLIEAVDAAEQARGFEPPVFVDTRLRRQGRAKGFVGDAFRDLVGELRYRHLQELGNEEIATGGTGVRIKNPAAVAKLLELAVNAAGENRRVIFYCACEFPKLQGDLACHRLTIAELLLNHAKSVGKAVTVIEWPGGQPNQTRLKVDRKLFAGLMNGARKSIPFNRERLPEFAGLPWASLAVIESEDGASGHVLVGPARFATSKSHDGYWYLPVIESHEPDLSSEESSRQATRWREAHGLNPLESAR